MAEIEIPKDTRLLLIPDDVLEALTAIEPEFSFLDELIAHFATHTLGPVVISGPKDLLDQIRVI